MVFVEKTKCYLKKSAVPAEVLKSLDAIVKCSQFEKQKDFS